MPVSKSEASKDAHSFQGKGFQICICNVGGPSVGFVELCKKDQEPEALKSNHSRVKTVHRDVGEVSICYKMGVVPPIMFDVVYEVDLNFFETFWYIHTLSLVFEAIIVVKLNHFRLGSIAHLVVSCFSLSLTACL